MYGLAWAPDSRSIIISSRRTGEHHLWSVPISPGAAQPLTVGVGHYVSPTLSSDGKTLAFCNTRTLRNLMMFEHRRDPQVRAITHEEFHSWPRLSPSGDKVLSVVRGLDFKERLFVTDVQNAHHTKISDLDASYPSWLDEDRIAFMSREAAGASMVHVLSLSSETDSKWTQFADDARWLAVHPDLRRLAIVLQSADGVQRIVLRDIERQSDQVLAQGSTYEALRWSPDGDVLAWSGPAIAGDHGANGIWTLKLGSVTPQHVAEDGHLPVWSSDSRRLYFARWDAGEATGLWEVDLQRNSPAKVQSWVRAPFFDVRGNRVVYAQDSGRAQIYAMNLR